MAPLLAHGFEGDWRPQWLFLVATVILCGLFVPIIMWHSYRVALMRIGAPDRLIRRVFGIRLVGIEVAVFPTLLTVSFDPTAPVGLAYLILGRLAVASIVLGMILTFASIWIEWRAQRQGRWRLRQ
jgi:hypothetical protein